MNVRRVGLPRRTLESILLVICTAACGFVVNRVADAGEWDTLFDGKTLTGWHKSVTTGHGNGGRWVVEDGVITGEQDPPGSGSGGILLTDQKYGDFELEIDIKPDWGVCTGLFIRSTETGQCYQIMVDYHDRGSVGHIYGQGPGEFVARPFDIFGQYDADEKLVGLKAIAGEGLSELYQAHYLKYTCTPDAWVEAWKFDDWNTLRVRCVGHEPTITTWINGLKVGEFDAATFKHPGYDRQFVREQLGREGHIAVQVHGGKNWPVGKKCRWRNIRIRQVAEGDAEDLSGSSWRPLFNGRNLDGLYTIIDGQDKNKDPDRLVQVHDGMIHIYKDCESGSQQPYGYFSTENEYSHYHLRLQYKWGTKRFAPRANTLRDSGVLFHLVEPDMVWPTSIECQVQEGDTGDLINVRTRSTGTIDPATESEQFPSYKPAKEGGKTYVAGWILASEILDKREGWNTVELIVRGSESATHIVNGRENNHYVDLRRPDLENLGEWLPLERGRIIFQLEGAEIFYRNIEIKVLASGGSGRADPR